MKRITLISFLILCTSFRCYAQNSFKNLGNLKVFEDAQIGFHTNLVNDGSFDENLGLVGFYQDGSLSISGAFSPIFNNFELLVENNLNLDVSIGISNSLNFVYGDIVSPRTDKSVYVQLLEDAFYIGEMQLSKVDGYVTIDKHKEFTFPVGYQGIIRPLQLEFMGDPAFAQCKYFHENPDNRENFLEDLSLDSRDSILKLIDSEEFWNLYTTGVIRVTISWKSDSTPQSIIENAENAVVVGWNKIAGRWENLGKVAYEHDLSEGFITSGIFDADAYETFTLGCVFDFKANTPGNYLLTPNSDGINDTLVLEIIEQSPNNELKIFNRWGKLVYEMNNYQDQFGGVPNKATFGKDKSLPDGIYYYIIELKDLNQSHQGFFYIAQ